ncbi:MAG: putative rane protein [Actinomycetia bacterium]|nr:putative rane protein [Actinomycetes bacterium]
MNTASMVAFGIAFVFAVGNWFAVARPGRLLALEYVCKPATLVALIFAAGLLDPAADAHTRRIWFVAALVCSLAGDVFLMLPGDLFVPGLAAFLVGHLAYLVGFWVHGPSAGALIVGVIVTAAAVTPIARRVLTAIAAREEPRELRIAVVAYMVVISAMLATALATGNAVAAVGAVLFVASDSMIAWDRFVRKFAWAPVAIMVTYHLGQAGLVASLVR